METSVSLESFLVISRFPLPAKELGRTFLPATDVYISGDVLICLSVAFRHLLSRWLEVEARGEGAWNEAMGDWNELSSSSVMAST